MISRIVEYVIGREPVAAGGVAAALVGLAVAFGLELTDTQQAAIGTAVAAVVAYMARKAVTPVRKLGRGQ